MVNLIFLKFPILPTPQLSNQRWVNFDKLLLYNYLLTLYLKVFTHIFILITKIDRYF